MSYSITTRDGITIDDIPDDVPPDAQELKDQVAQTRATKAEFAGQDIQQAPVTGEATGQDVGIMESLKEAYAGEQRATPESQLLPEWTGMPELNAPEMASFKAALGTMATSPEETVKIIKANYPDVAVRQDARGNYIMRSPTDNQEYVIAPGMRLSDIPRAAGTALAFTPAGRAASVPGAAAGAAGTQAAIEASQAATGGEFDPEDVAIAGIAGGAAPLAAKGIEAAVGGAKQVFGGAGRVAAEAVEATPEQVGETVRKASAGGFGSVKATEDLARMAKINPEAKAAADRLGIDLPADVFSDSPQVRAAAGLTRSAAGTEAEAAWRTAVSDAVDKADDAIRQFDTAFVEGAPSPGLVSQNIRSTLTKTRQELSSEAEKVYKAVDEAIPKSTTVGLPNLRGALSEIKSEVGVGGLSAQEKKLMALLDSGDVTYGRLIREKNLIGQAVAGKDSPYGNMEAAALKRLYGALAEDQLTNVANVGGDALRKQLRAANLLYAKERGLAKRIVNAFGEDTDGSVANLMRSAITQASKGDSAKFAKLMKVVPDDLKKETVATAIAAVTRSARGAERGGFGFSEFAKTYQGLRSNPEVYGQVVKVLGKDAHNTMRDLYEVSRRITDARANVLTTGKANQAIVESMRAEGLVQKVMDSSMARGAAAGASATVGGAPAAAGTSWLMSALSGGKKDAIQAAGKLFTSDEFQKLAIEAATTPEVSRQTIKRAAFSNAFKDFAEKIKLPMKEREQWILSALQAGRNIQQEQQ